MKGRILNDIRKANPFYTVCSGSNRKSYVEPKGGKPRAVAANSPF